ncbi:MAG: hypothetical protein RMK18_09675 [Armatimonadota bacterium]|nr:hypothetical protein [Armatimonadota bacterium]MDW8026113.1 hypothetical protein [Armatimonadota bacterium]
MTDEQLAIEFKREQAAAPKAHSLGDNMQAQLDEKRSDELVHTLWA